MHTNKSQLKTKPTLWLTNSQFALAAQLVVALHRYRRGQGSSIPGFLFETGKVESLTTMIIYVFQVKPSFDSVIVERKQKSILF